ncbi:PhoX family phosphatase [Acinetobacter sp. YH16032]|uniref:PhoX family protein n=1 Tax=Acinetobacter sp. YH16032 TaxID=2601181 RepID=UPI00211E6641|nr:PhoX family phosphatase [Acinetobacter sp. YH16032]
MTKKNQQTLTEELFQKKLTRRSFVKNSAYTLSSIALMTQISSCGNESNSSNDATSFPDELPSPTYYDEKNSIHQLNFKPVSKHIDDKLTVPEGYKAEVIYSTGDPIIEELDEWNDQKNASGASFQFRSGEGHDGMTFFGMKNDKYDSTHSDEGLLVLNHEHISPDVKLHPTFAIHNEDKILREINAHGVSIVHLTKDDNQNVNIKKNSLFNRRITPNTKMKVSGPVYGNSIIKTKLDPDGTTLHGTLNNCGNGYTPWGTYLTTEENFFQYFVYSGINLTKKNKYSLDRYGFLPQGLLINLNNWHIPFGNVQSDSRLFERWQIKQNKDVGPEQDFRNSGNCFGWIVEIDPFNAGEPIKRTALGRFYHEDCRVSRPIPGEPLAFYMGDDSKGEYIYKFVSEAVWDPKDLNGGYQAGNKYMDHGKLYVAKFNLDERDYKTYGEWIELSINHPLIINYSDYSFNDQADVLTNARIAADAVGATRMDRPEWVAINPKNGEVYVSLTNNSDRGSDDEIDPANPRSTGKGNLNGHIIRFKEANKKSDATHFEWDIFLFGSPADQDNSYNLSELSHDNDFSSPDGMWFDPRGVLWIQTDDSEYTDTSNCMMLAALPGEVGDGELAYAETGSTKLQTTRRGAKLNSNQLKRFLVGPKGCEITGITMTPDYKALFVNIQHPSGNWPNNHPAELNKSKGLSKSPRSATVVITRLDGGTILGETL